MTVVCLTGCGRQPQVSPANRRLVESLKTAVMAKNTVWLDQNARIIAERHRQGTLSDTEFSAFESIIHQAQAGDWSAAQDEVMGLSKAQSAAP